MTFFCHQKMNCVTNWPITTEEVGFFYDVTNLVIAEKIEGWRGFHPSGSDGLLSKVKSWEEQGQSLRWKRQHIFLPFKSHKNVGGATVWCHWPSPVSVLGVNSWALTFMKKPVEFDWIWTEKQIIQQRKNLRASLATLQCFLVISLFLFSFH